MIVRNSDDKQTIKASITIEIFKNHAEIHLIAATEAMGFGTQLLILTFRLL